MSVLPVDDLAAPSVPARLMKGKLDELAVSEGCWYSKRAADHAVNFFNKFLCHSKGEWAGKAFKLLEWQEWELIRPLFGWMRRDGTRRFRRAFVEIPKKNGKSTLGAGIALYLLKADGEKGAEVYSAAADHDQAAIVYREADSMVEQSPALKSMLLTTRSTKIIADPVSRSFYKALSADVPTKEGLNIHGLIFDELHAQKQRNLWDTLKYGGASRRQPLFISITTAGVDRQSVCFEQYEYAKRVLAGEVNDTSFFGLIYEATMEDDWTLEKTWRKANPSYGITIKADQFESDFKEARDNVSAQNAFRRYRLNQWTQQEFRWIDMEQWKRCPSKAPEIPKNAPFFGGLDLANSQDVAAFVQLFYEQGFFLRCHFFIPEEKLWERVRKDRVRYDVWAQKGFLTVTRGNVVDEEAIIRDVLTACGGAKCREIAYDRWNATNVVTKLADEGITMVPMGQGFASLNAPSKEFEKRIVSGTLNHGGNPVLEWMAGNVTTETDAAGNIKPSKKKSREKIDGVVASVMALGRWVVHNTARPSKYEKTGLTIL